MSYNYCRFTETLVKSNDSRFCTHTGCRPASRLCEDARTLQRREPVRRPARPQKTQMNEKKEKKRTTKHRENEKTRKHERTRDKTQQEGEKAEEKEMAQKIMIRRKHKIEMMIEKMHNEYKRVEHQSRKVVQNKNFKLKEEELKKTLDRPLNIMKMAGF